MQTLIRDTLELWREAERVLDHIPPSSPDHETVAALVLQLRDTYRRLSESTDRSQALIDASRTSIDDARGLLRQARSHGSGPIQAADSG